MTAKPPRQNVLDRSPEREIIASLTHKLPANRRTRPWDRENKDSHFACWGIPPTLQARVKSLAAELNVSVGDVTRRLLETGLDQYDHGALEMVTYRRPGPATLYPDDRSV